MVLDQLHGCLQITWDWINAKLIIFYEWVTETGNAIVWEIGIWLWGTTAQLLEPVMTLGGSCFFIGMTSYGWLCFKAGKEWNNVTALFNNLFQNRGAPLGFGLLLMAPAIFIGYLLPGFEKISFVFDWRLLPLLWGVLYDKGSLKLRPGLVLPLNFQNGYFLSWLTPAAYLRLGFTSLSLNFQQNWKVILLFGILTWLITCTGTAIGFCLFCEFVLRKFGLLMTLEGRHFAALGAMYAATDSSYTAQYLSDMEIDLFSQLLGMVYVISCALSSLVANLVRIYHPPLSQWLPQLVGGVGVSLLCLAFGYGLGALFASAWLKKDENDNRWWHGRNSLIWAPILVCSAFYLTPIPYMDLSLTATAYAVALCSFSGLFPLDSQSLKLASAAADVLLFIYIGLMQVFDILSEKFVEVAVVIGVLASLSLIARMIAVLGFYKFLKRDLRRPAGRRILCIGGPMREFTSLTIAHLVFGESENVYYKIILTSTCIANLGSNLIYGCLVKWILKWIVPAVALAPAGDGRPPPGGAAADALSRAGLSRTAAASSSRAAAAAPEQLSRSASHPLPRQPQHHSHHSSVGFFDSKMKFIEIHERMTMRAARNEQAREVEGQLNSVLHINGGNKMPYSLVRKRPRPFEDDLLERMRPHKRMRYQ